MKFREDPSRDRSQQTQAVDSSRKEFGMVFDRWKSLSKFLPSVAAGHLWVAVDRQTD